MQRSDWIGALALLLVASSSVAETASGIELTEDQARPLTDVTFQATPERLERGRWLVEGLLRCHTCHSPLDREAPGFPPIEGFKGAGRIYSEREGRRLVAPNLTPDPETGIGTWSDDMLARAIREGVGHDGRVLARPMPYHSMHVLADEDVAAIVVYLRAQAPIHHELPASALPLEEQERLARELKPLREPIDAPDRDDPVEYGRYLMLAADCAGCHTSWHSPINPGLLAGGNKIVDVFSSNITPHATGVGYSTETFMAVMRTGKGGTLSGRMPWLAYQHVPDRELAAIHALIRTVHPVAHLISNHVAPSQCAVCGQAHGLGDQNRIEMPEGIEVDPERLLEYVGDYRSEKYDWTVRVRVENGVLIGKDNYTDPKTLIALSTDRFLPTPNGLAPIRFERNADGRIDSMVTEELDPVTLDRLD